MNYYEFDNKYYNPDDYAKEPGDNENWKMIQRGFKKIESELATPFVVTFTNDAATQENPFGGHIDKTIAEITAAFRAGRPVQGHLVSESLSLDTFFNVYCYWYYNDNIVFSIIVQGVINGTYMVSEINTPQTDGNQYGVSYLFTAQ